MSYTATKYLSPRTYQFPMGQDNTQRMVIARGKFVENDTSTEYSPGGVGSTSFEVTAFSAVGLVTYSALVGVPLVNGQRVVVVGSTHNDGTYIVSAIAPTSATAGTFTAVPLPGKALNGNADTSQTAEGVGQIQFGNRVYIKQTFTATAITVSGGIATITYTTLVGPQLQPGDNVIIVGMTNAGNNSTFSLNAVVPTSSTGGSFTVTNAAAVATDSGTGTGYFLAGEGLGGSAAETPVQVNISSSVINASSPPTAYIYRWDYTNLTVRIFLTTTGAPEPLVEATIGATVLFDNTITFEAVFVRSGFNTPLG